MLLAQKMPTFKHYFAYHSLITNHISIELKVQEKIPHTGDTESFDQCGKKHRCQLNTRSAEKIKIDLMNKSGPPSPELVLDP